MARYIGVPVNSETGVRGLPAMLSPMPPTHGIDEPRQRDRVVEPFRVDPLRQPLRWGDRLAHLQLPDHRKLIAKPVFVE
jgi:hypothetical protein